MKTITTSKPALILISFILMLESCTSEPRTLFTGEPVYPDLNNVTLLNGPFKDAMEKTHSYLLEIEPDRLLHPFRLNAGLDTMAPAYRGWEERELRGNTTGHYLSACAMMYLATGDTLLRGRINYIVNALSECQKANGNGYVSAFPEEFIDRVENPEEVWPDSMSVTRTLAMRKLLRY